MKKDVLAFKLQSIRKHCLHLSLKNACFSPFEVGHALPLTIQMMSVMENNNESVRAVWRSKFSQSSDYFRLDT